MSERENPQHQRWLSGVYRDVKERNILAKTTQNGIQRVGLSRVFTDAHINRRRLNIVSREELDNANISNHSEALLVRDRLQKDHGEGFMQTHKVALSGINETKIRGRRILYADIALPDTFVEERAIVVESIDWKPGYKPASTNVPYVELGTFKEDTAEDDIETVVDAVAIELDSRFMGEIALTKAVVRVEG